MSRFWGGASDTESEEDIEDLTDDEQQESGSDDEGPNQGSNDGSKRLADFLNRYDSDDDDDDNVKRVVRSQRDKRYEFISTSMKAMHNYAKINDWANVLSEFENLTKGLTKAQQLLEKEGYPRNFIKMYAELEDAVEQAWENKEARKKMNAIAQKGLSSMKQRLRKARAPFEKDLEAFRAAPWETEDSADERAVSETESEEDEGEDEGAEEAEEDDDGFKVVGKKGRKGKKAEEDKSKAFIPENLERMLTEVIHQRGKRNTDTKKLAETLRKLIEIAETPAQKVTCMLLLVAVQFDKVISLVTYLPPDEWTTVHADLIKLFDFLDANPTIVVREDVAEAAADDTELDESGADTPVTTARKARGAAAKPSQDKPGFTYITGSIAAIIERLDEELNKSLQQTDAHTIEYLERLRFEIPMYEAIVRAQRYLERVELQDPLCRVVIRRVEHIYYKRDTLNNKIESNLAAKLGYAAEDSSALMQRLCIFLYQNASDRIRTRALLCHAYHHALHDRFQQARDLFLMSHLQETINLTDTNTKILYNRAMVQLGLSAFRHGLTRETQNALLEVFTSGKIKELLAQGIVQSRFGEKDPEQEKLERQRQYPFHMHINYDLLEAVYYTSAMIQETAYMASESYEPRRRPISKPFRRLMEIHRMQLFTAPPENTREHVAHATKALLQGDWRKCQQYIFAIKIWDLLPNKAKIFEMLARKIQEEGLRVYMLSYGNLYENVSLERLATLFELSPSAVQSVLSRMIYNEELHAALDPIAGVVVLQRTDPSRLRALAMQYAEKVGAYVDANERLFEIKIGTFGREDRGGRRGGRGGAAGDRGGRAGGEAGGERGERAERPERGERSERGGYGGGERGGYGGGERGGRGGGRGGFSGFDRREQQRRERETRSGGQDRYRVSGLSSKVARA